MELKKHSIALPQDYKDLLLIYNSLFSSEHLGYAHEIKNMPARNTNYQERKIHARFFIIGDDSEI
jgi:hypothetical protein